MVTVSATIMHSVRKYTDWNPQTTFYFSIYYKYAQRRPSTGWNSAIAVEFYYWLILEAAFFKNSSAEFWVFSYILTPGPPDFC